MWSDDLTWNLGKMSFEAGIKDWRKLAVLSETEPTSARVLVASALEALQRDEEKMRTFTPDNGFGTYEWLLRVVRGLSEAWCEHPEARLEVM